MGASQLMTVGLRTVAASYAALQTTGNNISNAHVAGYSRQRVELASAQGRPTGDGVFGMGVDVQTVSRQFDQLRAREAVQTASVAKMDEARLKGLNQLEAIFQVGEGGFGHAATQFLNAVGDVAARPTDIAARQVVLARATDVAYLFAQAGKRFEEIQNSIVEEVDASVVRANELARGIAEVNERLARSRSLGHTFNDLLDERDRLLGQLNEIVRTTHYETQEGSLMVTIPGGHTLVMGSRANALSRVADPEDPARAALACDQLGVRRTVDDAGLAGGSLAGWIRLQNEDLVAARNEIGRLSAAFAGAVNKQQSFGLDLRGFVGSPMFETGSPRVVPASGNALDAGGAQVARVELSITDPSQLKASDYSLKREATDPAGTWRLTRLSDGVSQAVVDGDEVDGFRISLGTPPPADTDRFLLQPVGYAAHAMRRILDDPAGFAAASPWTAKISPGNTGVASVSLLRANSPASDAAVTYTVRFTSNEGDYEVLDGAGSVLEPASRRWRPGEKVVIDGSSRMVDGVLRSFDGFEVQLDGTPRQGDSFNVGRTVFAAGNNGNALATVELRDEKFVGRTVDRLGALVDAGRTVTEAYAAAVGNVGVTVQRARTAADISSSVAAAAQADSAAASGVNLEEEAARLLQYQQSYQAGAKVLQAAQTTFDSLLQVLG